MNNSITITSMSLPSKITEESENTSMIALLKNSPQIGHSHMSESESLESESISLISLFSLSSSISHSEETVSHSLTMINSSQRNKKPYSCSNAELLSCSLDFEISTEDSELLPFSVSLSSLCSGESLFLEHDRVAGKEDVRLGTGCSKVDAFRELSDRFLDTLGANNRRASSSKLLRFSLKISEISVTVMFLTRSLSVAPFLQRGHFCSNPRV